MFSKEEDRELTETAVDLAYTSIRFSGLHRSLENSEWDRFAQELASEARTVINRRIQERIDEIEARAA